MSLCKAILHTPRMMYGGREDMCPHLHTITPYYLIPFRFPVLSQEGGYIVCLYQQWYIYQNDPNKYYPTIYIFMSVFLWPIPNQKTDLFQINQQRSQQSGSPTVVAKMSNLLWWWTLKVPDMSTIFLFSYANITEICDILQFWQRLLNVLTFTPPSEERDKNEIKCKLVLLGSLGHKLD